MNSLIESLNVWGGRFMDFAPTLLWQSSILMVLVFVIDFFLRRKLRPAVRYTLWFVVFVKLLLPPTLAFPTGAAWWLRTREVQVIAPHPRTMTVSYQREPAAEFVPRPMVLPRAPIAPPPVRLSRDAWFLITSFSVSVLLGAWVLFRWRQVAQCVRRATGATNELRGMLSEACRRAGLRKNVRLQLTSDSMSPAVCGLLRPVVLLPQSLVNKLTANQLQAVLLHELIHLKRRDVWVNCAQTLLQIVYWWHPLLWFANARVRRVREEAVDDAVMFALSDEAEVYAPTLLEVAKLAFHRPLATLGLVGILESRNALRHRIERLLNFSAPRRVGVSVMSVIGIAAFTALAVPMGEPPARISQADDVSDSANLIPYHAKVNPEVFIRNVQARAPETMHNTNDNTAEILASVLEGFGVNCYPPRDITFNPQSGEIAMQNTSAALQVVDEVVKELNLPGGERILNPPYGLKNVLIEAQFYLIRPDDFAKLGLDPNGVHKDENVSPWWRFSPSELTEVEQRIRDLGLQNLSAPGIQTSTGIPFTGQLPSPRINTANGIAASLFVGDVTNSVQLECVPYVSDDFVKMTVLARTTGRYAPDGQGWPDFAGHTNCAIFTRIGVTNGDGVLLRAQPAGTSADNELIVVLKPQLVEPRRSKDKVPFLGDLPGVGRLFRSPANEPTNFGSFIFHFDKDTVAQLLAKFAEEHKVADATNSALLMQKFLENAGVNLNPPKSFFYSEASGFLAMRAETKDLQKTAQALGLNLDIEQLRTKGRSLYQLGKLDEAEAAFKEVLKIKPNDQAALWHLNLIEQSRAKDPAAPRNITSSQPFPPLARTNTIYTSPARQKIYDKLNNITFDKISFPDLPLSEVVRNLTEMTQRRDIDQQGINFLVNRSIPKPAVGSNPQPQAFDPTTGAPIMKAPATEDIDPGTVTISLDPGLRNVRLVDVLEAIVRSSNHPIKYSLLDYGVEFSLKGPEQLQLHTRTFKLDPNTFFTGLQNVTGMNFGNTNSQIPPGTNSPVGHGRSLRYVTGLDSTTEIQLAVINFFNAIGVNLTAPKSVFFNNRQGTLTVHTTDEDLELIEQAINTLNIAPPQVTVKVRFLEVDLGDTHSLGFNWYLGNFLGANNKIPGAGGTAAATHSFGAPATQNPPLASLSGILTDSQLKVILRALDKRDGSKLLSEGEVTTLSGRQADFQVVDVKTVATGLNATIRSDGTNYNYEITNMPFGATLDVVPTVLADGYSISMTVVPRVTEFLGYEDPKELSNDPKFKGAQVPLPKTRVREMRSEVTVWDGQTLVLDNLNDELIVSGANGAASRRPFADDKKKRLLIFITPTIIDPTGNRVHSTDYYDSPVL